MKAETPLISFSPHINNKSLIKQLTITYIYRENNIYKEKNSELLISNQFKDKKSKLKESLISDGHYLICTQHKKKEDRNKLPANAFIL